MSKQHLHLLLSRYLDGTCTERERHLVEQWFTMLDSKVLTQETEPTLLDIEEKMWTVIQSRSVPAKTRQLFTASCWWVAAAAVLMIGVVIGYFNLRNNHPRIHRDVKGLVEVHNVTHKDQQVMLPDSSRVVLLPNSIVWYPKAFKTARREVHLKGQAFFHVTPMPEKPFYVYTGEIVTKVLGTSFWVQEDNGSNDVQVSVVSGKVSVSRDGDSEDETRRIKNGVFLTANQKVTYLIKSASFETGLVNASEAVVLDEREKQNKTECFKEDTSMAEVFAHLEREYGIEIIFENEATKNCLFRGDITEQSLFTKLELLCSSVNATYEIRGTRILIRGPGCQKP